MMMRDMCPYHTPCGFCAKFDKPCKEVCDNNNKNSSKTRFKPLEGTYGLK